MLPTASNENLYLAFEFSEALQETETDSNKKHKSIKFQRQKLQECNALHLPLILFKPCRSTYKYPVHIFRVQESTTIVSSMLLGECARV